MSCFHHLGWEYSFNPEDVTVVKKYHKCKSCDAEILQDNKIIYEHITLVHKLTAHSYRQLNAVATAGDDRPSGEVQPLGGLRGPASATILRNACSFQCPVEECSALLSGWAYMRRHLRISHPQLLKKRATCNPVDYVIKRSWHHCNLCGKKLLQDKSLIKNHLSSAHKITRFEKYDIPPGKEQNHAKEIQNKNPNPAESLRADAAKAGRYEQKSSDHGELSSKCKFRCEPCNKVFHNWTATINHLKMRHSKDRESGVGKKIKHDINKFVIERHHHTCFLCGKEVLQDLKLISCHIGAAHKMPLSRYRQLLMGKEANPCPQPQTRQPKSRQKITNATEVMDSDKGQKEQDSPKMDPRVLNLDIVKSLIKEESFECRICGR